MTPRVEEQYENENPRWRRNFLMVSVDGMLFTCRLCVPMVFAVVQQAICSKLCENFVVELGLEVRPTTYARVYTIFGTCRLFIECVQA